MFIIIIMMIKNIVNFLFRHYDETPLLFVRRQEAPAFVE